MVTSLLLSRLGHCDEDSSFFFGRLLEEVQHLQIVWEVV